MKFVHAGRLQIARLSDMASASPLRRNFFKIARANIIAMILPIIVTPILTRFFSSSDFGVLAIFSSTLALTTAICTWRFDWVIPNARTTKMAAGLFLSGVTVLFSICIISIIIILILESPIFQKPSPIEQLGLLIYILPIAIAGTGMRQMLSGWFVRQGDLSAVGHATIAQSVSNTVAGLILGAMNLGAFGLIAATTTSIWIGTTTLVRQVRGLRLWLPNFRLIVRAAVRRHHRTANWSTLVSLVNAMSFNAPVLLLAYFYDPQQIGWYALMFRLLAKPTGAFSSALGQSFWAQAAQYMRKNKYQKLASLYKRTTVRLGLACVPILIVCFLGPLFVGPLLGTQEWGGAGYVLLAMAPFFVGSIMFSPTSHLVVIDKQHFQLIADLARLGLVILAVVIAGRSELDFVWTVALASLSSMIGHLILFAIHLKVHQNELRQNQDVLESANEQSQ